MKILVTGASGNLGKLVVEKLLKLVDAKSIVAGSRDLSKIENLKSLGIETRRVDFDSTEIMDKAFEGIDKILMISTSSNNRHEQHKRAIDSAKKAHVKFIVYTSLTKANEERFFLATDHKITEEYLKQSGISHTILRNNWYFENELGNINDLKNGNPWVTTNPNAKVGWALRGEYAKAAAIVISSTKHINKVYELSGPMYTVAQIVEAYNRVTRQKAKVKQVSLEEFEQMLVEKKYNAQMINFVLGIEKAISQNALEVKQSDFERVLERKLTPLDEVIKKLI